MSEKLVPPELGQHLGASAPEDWQQQLLLARRQRDEACQQLDVMQSQLDTARAQRDEARQQRYEARQQLQQLQQAGVSAGPETVTTTGSADPELAARLQELQQHNQHLSQTLEQLKLAEAGRGEADKLAALGRLAAGVAHEINNPLAIFSGNLGALRSYVHDIVEVAKLYGEVATAEDSSAALAQAQKLEQTVGMAFIVDDTANLLREMEDAVVRIQTVVKDLKGYARVDTPDTDRVSIDQCVQHSAAVCSQIERETIHWQVELGQTPAIMCRPAQINELIMQLLRNAVQATPAQANITVRTRQENGEVVLEVIDDGEGIRPEHLNQVFEPFYTTRPVGQGQGMGLTRARAIALEHGGTIAITSTPGTGTTVTVRLPTKAVVAA